MTNVKINLVNAQLKQTAALQSETEDQSNITKNQRSKRIYIKITVNYQVSRESLIFPPQHN